MGRRKGSAGCAERRCRHLPTPPHSPHPPRQHPLSRLMRCPARQQLSPQLTNPTPPPVIRSPKPPATPCDRVTRCGGLPSTISGVGGPLRRDRRPQPTCSPAARASSRGCCADPWPSDWRIAADFKQGNGIGDASASQALAYMSSVSTVALEARSLRRAPSADGSQLPSSMSRRSADSQTSASIFAAKVVGAAYLFMSGPT